MATDLDCRVVYLNDSTHVAADNCVGIEGYNQLVFDTSTDTDVALTYRNGSACFAGTIAPEGWGAVYNFSFADDTAWDATEFDVAALQFEASGSSLPAQLELIYSDTNSDYCRLFQPAARVSIPFTSTHENCATNPGSRTPASDELVLLRLHFPVSTTAYDVEFCLRISATP